VVISDERSSCQECLGICPAKDALTANFAGFDTKIRWNVFPAFAIVAFLLCVAFGIATGRWHNSVSEDLYRDAVLNRKNIGHPGQTGSWQK